MNKKQSLFMTYVGIGLCAVSFAWWYLFFSKVISAFGGGKLSDAFKCWYSSSDNVCATVTAGAKFFNQTPYEPWMLYVGLLVGLIGTVSAFNAKE